MQLKTVGKTRFLNKRRRSGNHKKSTNPPMIAPASSRETQGLTSSIVNVAVAKTAEYQLLAVYDYIHNMFI